MESARVVHYLELLDIRSRAARRDARISGAVFLISLLSFFALGMTGRLPELGIWVFSAMLVAFGFSFVLTSARLEMLKQARELAENLLPTAGRGILEQD